MAHFFASGDSLSPTCQVSRLVSFLVSHFLQPVVLTDAERTTLKSAHLIPLLPWLKNLQHFPVMHLSEPRSTPSSSVLLCCSFACMQRFLQTLSVLQASACSFRNVVPSCWEGCLPPRSPTSGAVSGSPGPGPLPFF